MPGQRPDQHVDVVIVGAGILGINQLYRAVEAGTRSACSSRATASVARGTGTATRAPASTPRATPTGTSSRRTARRVGLVRALRRAGRDRGVPELRRREARPARPHAIPHPDLVGRLRRAVGDVDPATEDGDERSRSRFVVGHEACCRCRTGQPSRAASDYQGEAYHTGQWPKEPVDFAGKTVAVIGTGASAVQLIPEIAGEVADAGRLPAHTELELSAQQREDHRRGAGRHQGDLRRDLRRLHGLVRRLRAQGVRQRAFDVTKEERWALYEQL